MAQRIVTPEYITGNLTKFNEFAGTKLEQGKVEGQKKPILKDGDNIISRPMPIWMLIPYAEAYVTAKVGLKKASEMPRPVWPWDKAAEMKTAAKGGKKAKTEKKAAAPKAKKAKKTNPAPVAPADLKDPAAPKAEGAKEAATVANAPAAAPAQA